MSLPTPLQPEDRSPTIHPETYVRLRHHGQPDHPDAQYLLFPILIAAAATWLFLPRHDKVGLAVQAIVSLVIAVALIQLAASILVGVARVAAHVHHAQDIAAGVLIAALAVGAAIATWRWVRPRLPRRLSELASL